MPFSVVEFGPHGNSDSLPVDIVDELGPTQAASDHQRCEVSAPVQQHVAGRSGHASGKQIVDALGESFAQSIR